MAKWSSSSRANGKTKKKLTMVEKVLLLGKRWSGDDFDHDHEELEDSRDRDVPNDVKEGHFAVIAVDDEELKRFIVPLSCLRHPTFLRLLEQAQEEFGYDHEGALMLPCSPSVLETILAEQWVKESINTFYVK